MRSLVCLLVFSLVLLFWQCAQVVPLTGGERDRIPPKLVQAVPENNTTNFLEREIVLKFNELVQLKDMSNQVLISPRPSKAPEIRAEGRNVVIKFQKDVLEPNTTYKINFGNAIADVNESNSLQGFVYVFSTGAFIDSMRLSGQVVQASNNASAADVLVGLYRIGANKNMMADSAPMKEPPVYAARANADGRWQITHLPVGEFYLAAFRDNNRNNKYDPVSEKVAFAGMVNTRDSVVKSRLRLFQEEPSKLFVRRAFSALYSAAQIELNKPADIKLQLLQNIPGASLYVPQLKVPEDTIVFFYRGLKDTMQLRVTSADALLDDTVTIVLPQAKPIRRRPRTFKNNTSQGVLAAGRQLQFSFPVWMDTSTFRKEKIRIQSERDSIARPFSGKAYWNDISTLNLDVQFRDNISYTLQIDTAMVEDITGIVSDSTRLVVRRQNESDLGKLFLNLLLPKKQAYVCEILNQSEKVVAAQAFSVSLSSSNLVRLTFESLLPGTYKAKLIFDDNANGRWDTGSLLQAKQPEKVSIGTKEIKMLADWEIEERIEIKIED